MVREEEQGCRIDESTTEKMSNPVQRVVVETVVAINQDRSEFVAENKHSGLKVTVLESKSEAARRTVDKNHRNPNIDHSIRVLDRVDQGTSDGMNFNDPVDRILVETVVVIDSDEAACANGGNGEPKSSKSSEKSMVKICKAEKDSCLIDMGYKDGKLCGESWEGERICRICHLTTDLSVDAKAMAAAATSPIGLIQLGCGCKDELGTAHSHCAEAWFKLKGNRVCEICGEMAKNVARVGDNRFMEEWNEGRLSSNISRHSSDRGESCWRGQPFCNFLMACLIISFVLPWFFRINIF